MSMCVRVYVRMSYIHVCMCLVRACMMYVCRVFIHVHVCCSSMCMRLRMSVLVYVCAGVCEHVTHSRVCRAFVVMPCVNAYLYTNKLHQTSHCE